MSTPEPLTADRRREMTRSHVLAAAAAVFAERGYHGATLDEIARRAGFTKGAVYSNFTNKEELFLSLFRERQQTTMHAFFDALGESPARISEVFARMAPTSDEYALWLEFELYARRKPELQERLRLGTRAMFDHLVELLDDRVARLGVTPSIPVHELARLYAAIFDGLAHDRALDPRAVPDELFARLVDFIDDAAFGAK